MRTFFKWIWNISEMFNLPLWRFAPFVFGMMIWATGCKKIEEYQREIIDANNKIKDNKSLLQSHKNLFSKK